MPIKAVLWDLDGTILDTEHIFDQVILDLNDKYGFALPSNHVAAEPGHCLKTCWNNILIHNQPDITFQSWSDEVCKTVLQQFSSAALKENVLDVIKEIHKQDMTQICVSNSMHYFIETALSRTGLRLYFSGVLGRESVLHGKPAPDIYLKALKDYELKVSDCIVVEDSVIGAQSARAAGLQVIAVPTRNDGIISIQNPDFVAKDRKDILTFICQS